MLAKLTRGNQFTIPKPIIEQARLKAGRDYLSVEYLHGVIVLKPVDVTPRISSKNYAALLRDAFTARPGDIVADERSAPYVLKRRMNKR